MTQQGPWESFPGALPLFMGCDYHPNTASSRGGGTLPHLLYRQFPRKERNCHTRHILRGHKPPGADGTRGRSLNPRVSLAGVWCPVPRNTGTHRNPPCRLAGVLTGSHTQGTAHTPETQGTPRLGPLGGSYRVRSCYHRSLSSVSSRTRGCPGFAFARALYMLSSRHAASVRSRLMSPRMSL